MHQPNPNPSPSPADDTLDLLALLCAPGLGPVLISRLLQHFSSPTAVLKAEAAALAAVKGIGPQRAASIARNRAANLQAAKDEARRAADAGVTLLPIHSPLYPPLLATIADPPPILYVRGELRPLDADRYPIALVGSRACSAYGREQAERFAGQLASAGITVISGGARGIDSAAHLAAMRCAGRTIAVLGCGLQHIYPRENAELFDQIAQPAAARGAIVSELPMATAPTAENFPARNRIISGLALGTLVIEAGKGSGSLITARLAAEDHGREVFAVPGRVDSAASEGTHELIKSGGAALVTSPADVIAGLESAARHLHAGSHAARFGPPPPQDLFSAAALTALAADNSAPQGPNTPPAHLTPTQAQIYTALQDQATFDDLVLGTNLSPSQLRSDLTLLELQRIVIRRGSAYARRPATPPSSSSKRP